MESARMEVATEYWVLYHAPESWQWFGGAKRRAEARLKGLRFHDRRHAFACRLVRAAVPLYEVMRPRGDKFADLVQRYAHPAPDHANEAMMALYATGHGLGGYGLAAFGGRKAGSSLRCA